MGSTEGQDAAPQSHGLASVDPPIAMLILERDFRIRWISQAAVTELRLRPDQLVGRSWYDIFPESRARRPLHEELVRGERASLDLPRVPLSLTCGTRYFSLRLRPMLGADGSVESILGIGEDVTAQAHAELALRTSEERFRALSTHSTDMMIIGAADGTVTYENEAVARILGPRPAPRSGATVFDNLHPDDVSLARDLYAKLNAGTAVGETHDLIVRTRDADGRWRWLHFTASNLLADPAVGGVVLRGRDVTEQKTAEIALRESEARLEAAVGGTAIGLWEGEIDEYWWFGDWCERCDIDPCNGSNSLGRWRARIHPEDVARYAVEGDKSLSGAIDHYVVEYRILTRAGEWRWLHERGRVTSRDPSGVARRYVGVCIDIDSRKQLEAALRKAEDRYQLAIDAARLPVWEYDVAKDAVTGNVYWHETLGFEVADGEALRRVETWLSDVHPEDLAQQHRVFEGAAADDSGFYQSEFRMKAADGSYKWLLDRGKVVERSSDGTPLKLVGVSVNIDAQKQLQASLRASEVRLETAIGGSDVGLWDWNVDAGSLVWLSDWPRQIGFKASEEPCTLEDILAGVHPDDRERMCAAVEATTSGGQDFSASDYRLLVASGDWRWVHVRATVIERGAGGRAKRIAGACVDVDARRRVEELLRTQATVLETMREGVVLIDRAGRIELANAAFTRMCGHAAGELTGSSILDLLAIQQAGTTRPANVDRFVERAQDATGTWDALFRRKDGAEFVAEVLTAAVDLAPGRRWFIVVQDVSERKRLEREVLDIANRERRRFGHDLHDGLCQELTGVALMLRGVATDLKRDIVPTVRHVEELVALVNRAIENSREMARGLSPVTVERGGLVPALNALAHRSRESFGISVRLRSKLLAGQTIDEAMASHLYRITQEAINNAVRHGRARAVVVSLQVNADKVQLSVSDDGIGLPAHAAEGPGMGLKIMNYRARMMGGVVDVGPRRSGGTRVHCVCPAPARSAPHPHPATALGSHVR